MSHKIEFLFLEHKRELQNRSDLVLRRNQKLEQRKNVLRTLPITKLPFVSKVAVIGIDKAFVLMFTGF
jgi:hypothetical protein